MQPLSLDDILDRLSLAYQEDYPQRVASLLHDEQVYWVGNFSRGDTVRYRHIGYVLITDQRVLQAAFRTNNGFFNERKEVRLRDGLTAFELPVTPLTKGELQNRSFAEMPILSAAKYIEKQSELNTFIQNKTPIGEVMCCKPGEPLMPMLFLYPHEARELRGVIQNLANPPVESLAEPTPQADARTAGWLAQLDALHREGALTDKEFQSITRRLNADR